MCFTESSLSNLTFKFSDHYVMHYFILATMSHYFISAGLFSNTEKGTGLHAAKSFDNVLCSKFEMITFLITRKGQDNSKKYGQS